MALGAAKLRTLLLSTPSPEAGEGENSENKDFGLAPEILIFGLFSRYDKKPVKELEKLYPV